MPDSTRKQALAALARFHPGDAWPRPALARLVALGSTLIMRTLNDLEIRGLERLQALREKREGGLLTFSNHVSMLDDPLLLSCFGVGAYEELRWIAADALNFFGDPARAFLANAGKCVPVIRGAGTKQAGMDFLVERLRAGEWVHVFPEGGRTRDPHALLRQPFKTGVDRLILEARPTCLGFYHYGMHELLPIGAKFPRAGKKVIVEFGQPAAVADISAAPSEWMLNQLQALERTLNPNPQKPR